MSVPKYAIYRLRAFLDEVENLKQSEFPYRYPWDALEIIEDFFETKLLKPLMDPDTSLDYHKVEEHSSVALRAIYDYLPTLGFILRSTNVRNGFEFYGPVLELAEKLLPRDDKHEEAKLLFSSEWEYSPFNDMVIDAGIPGLSDFVFIGLPATESSNPLFVPLAGHELGHSVWRRNVHLQNEFWYYQIYLRLVRFFNKNWTLFSNISPDPPKKPSDLKTNRDIYNILYRFYSKYIASQAEETFCDFLGLRIFGKSYLSSFAYWISPNLRVERPLHYPMMSTRVHNLQWAARKFNIKCPSNYASLFIDFSVPVLDKAADYRLTLADETLKSAIPRLLTMTDELVKKSGIKSSTQKAVKKIHLRFNQISPAEESQTLADIINAGWTVFENLHRWQGRNSIGSPDDDPIKRERKSYHILQDLVLKNIEVFEIEQIKSNKIKSIRKREE